MGQGGDGPMAAHPLHEPSPVDRGSWVGLHRRSGVVFVCSPHPQHTLLLQRGSACRAAGCGEQLFQWLYTLHMRPSPPVLASGPVSTAVPGWLASALPPERSLARTHLRQDVKTAERTNASFRVTPNLCEMYLRSFLVVGVVGSAFLCHSVSVLPLQDVSC